MELLRVLAWISLGWLAASLVWGRPKATQPVDSPVPSLPVSLSESPLPCSKPHRTSLCEDRSVAEETGRQRLATMCLRDGKSLIYIAVCPWHKVTADANSSGRCFSWDVETGMAHCFWCGWGGRVARPLPGPVHPDLLPSTFRLVLVT